MGTNLKGDVPSSFFRRVIDFRKVLWYNVGASIPTGIKRVRLRSASAWHLMRWTRCRKRPRTISSVFFHVATVRGSVPEP